MARKSFWAWGMEDTEPTDAQRREAADSLSRLYGVPLEAPPVPKDADLDLRKPRITPPSSLESICSTDLHDRAAHSYGRNFADKLRAFRCEFPNPPDVVAYPKTEEDIERLLHWCQESGYVVIPFGGGSSTVHGIEPDPEAGGAVTIDMGHLDRVLEIDDVSRSARIQAGVYGPALEDQLRPHGFTLRHFPQSFEFSSLGGWIATRSGGHYATNHTHIDDFVESVRVLTPAGLLETRRLPGSGAGPSPDRLILGSEGTLGIITEAWMRIQVRPKFRASAGVNFPTFEAGWNAARRIVQAKLWPANCRLLDPGEAGAAAGLDGAESLLVIGFESAEVPQAEFIREAVTIARDAGGQVDEDNILISGETGRATGRQGAVGAWRDSFVNAPYNRNVTTGFGFVEDTLETAVTWDQWPKLDTAVRGTIQDVLDRLCGGGRVTCRFTHVYTDGPAPYYTFVGYGPRGGEIEAHDAIKEAASDAIIANGGTITHHHAVGRLHKPWYNQENAGLFIHALRAAKRALDPGGIMNPGVLIDP